MITVMVRTITHSVALTMMLVLVFVAVCRAHNRRQRRCACLIVSVRFRRLGAIAPPDERVERSTRGRERSVERVDATIHRGGGVAGLVSTATLASS
tara:strand:+ start:243 stop:530 length:288 start_codon:yes stop_codon:yes gene_type:complete